MLPAVLLQGPDLETSQPQDAGLRSSQAFDAAFFQAQQELQQGKQSPGPGLLLPMLLNGGFNFAAAAAAAVQQQQQQAEQEEQQREQHEQQQKQNKLLADAFLQQQQQVRACSSTLTCFLLVHSMNSHGGLNSMTALYQNIWIAAGL